MSERANTPNRLSDAQRALLAARLRKGRTVKADTIGRRPADADVPLSFAQEQLWFLDRFAPGRPTYNIPHVMWLTGPLDLAALGQAVRDLVGRHESLRTRLIEGRRPGAAPRQQIDPAGPVDLPLIELADDDLEPARRRAREFAAEQAVLPFDLAAGPLFRLQLLRLAPTEHALVMVMHHSIFDAWSLGVFVPELIALYRQANSGEPAGLPELPVQLADHAVWERQRLAEPSAELIDYWRERLAGAPTLELGTDHPRPSQESFRGEVQWVNFGTELLAGLRELSRAEGSTLFATLLSGLYALLHRYTGQDDLVIGAPSANRGRAELTGLIGFLVNTLPIRIDLSGDPSFSTLLGQVHERTISAYAHQELPFARLVDALQVPRDPGRSPVFQVVMTFAEQLAEIVAGELTVRVDKIDLPAAKFDLNFFAEVRPDGLWVELAYASDLFEPATIARLLDHYRRLLAGAVARPADLLSQLPLLSAEELQHELVTCNDTVVELPTGCLHELFQDQVQRTPAATAATFGDDQVSFAELNANANRLARRLGELGVGPSVLVGIAMPASIERLIALLAILKAGGGYVPLDPSLPADRLAFMISDAGLPAILIDPAAGTELPASGAQLIPVDRHATPGEADLTAADPDPSAEPSDIAYVIYTSGSTGRPKGVVVEHRNAVNFIGGQLRHWQLGPADRVLQFASLNFDVSVLDIFGALLAGATLVLASRDTLLSPPRLGALLRESRISFASLPPALLNLLADQDFPDLRVLISAGEELRSELATRWLRPGLRLCNGYGPTETTVLSAFVELDAGLLPPPIGRPPANYQAYVLDAHLNPVPAGVIGELHTGGAGVARGYLNQPELTAERFLPDPFSGDPDARLYRTGDLVKRLPDGNLMFVGRIDGQVKLRGLRVELGEVEVALAGLPGVQQAVAAVLPDQAGERQLVGYLRCEAAAPDLAEYRRQLGRWLPSYMVPGQLVVLDAFPLNASGKVDRHALPVPGAAATATAIEPPATLIEAMLVDIYAGLLNVDEVSVEAGFFDAGGNSLQAMQLISRIEDSLGVEVAVAEIFLAPQPRELARVLVSEHGLRDADLGDAGIGSLDAEALAIAE